jgi:hypothetical protein
VGGAPAACAALVIEVCSKIAVAMPTTIFAFQFREEVIDRIVIAPVIDLFLVVAVLPAVHTQYGTFLVHYPRYCRPKGYMPKEFAAVKSAHDEPSGVGK